jgi:putative addiction module killer protein
VKAVGDGVSELRIAYGRATDVYFTRRGSSLVILLCGGDKSSQPRDIRTAKALAKDVINAP